MRLDGIELYKVHTCLPDQGDGNHRITNHAASEPCLPPRDVTKHRSRTNTEHTVNSGLSKDLVDAFPIPCRLTVAIPIYHTATHDPIAVYIIYQKHVIGKGNRD